MLYSHTFSEMVDVAIAIQSIDAKRHIQELMSVVSPEAETRAAPFTLETIKDVGSKSKQLVSWLRRYFLEDCGRLLVLISDLLLRGDDASTDRLAAAEFLHELERFALGTIAITPLRGRVADIDRTIAPDVTKEVFKERLNLVVDRVRYLSAPQPLGDVSPQFLSIRPIRLTNQTELRDYFELRHRVYMIMGYLDESLEVAPSRLEINEADLRAIHIGAFYRDPNDPRRRERLIGTARIVTNDEPQTALKDRLEQLASNDPLLRRRLSDPYPLALPIFQSYDGMNSIMREIFRRNQKCGELSRVIVVPEFRGHGISRMLVTEALDRISERGVERVFLECLRVHQTLYESLGFRVLPGIGGAVVDVGRTMIAMESRTNQIIRHSRPPSGRAD